MKYDDDELAEAAVFLAHADATSEMPPGLEEKILAQGTGVASEIRFTTTKGAALTVEDLAPEPRPQRSTAHAWVGWLAAAACFAFAVYEWRLHAAPPTDRATATAQNAIQLADANGGLVGSLHRDADGGAWEVMIDHLAATDDASHYRVWLSASDEEHAVPYGAFACTSDCVRRSFAIGAIANTAPTKRIWITRNAKAEQSSVLPASAIVARGTLEVP